MPAIPVMPAIGHQLVMPAIDCQYALPAIPVMPDLIGHLSR